MSVLSESVVTIRFQPEDLVDRVPEPGWHKVAVEGVWKRPTGTGSLAVKVKFVVTDDGDFDGVELWDQFVVEGASEEGEQVARRRLARLLRACGVKVVPNVDMPITVRGEELLVKVVPDSFRGQVRARLKGYRPLVERANGAEAGEAKDEDAPEDEEPRGGGPTPF